MYRRTKTMKNFIYVASFAIGLTVGIIFAFPAFFAPKFADEIITAKTVEVEKSVLPEVSTFGNNEEINASFEEEELEIKSCVPQKLYRGETLKVSLGKKHGDNAAILRLADDKWFFLNYVENSRPVWTYEEFESLSGFEINMATAVNSTNTGFEDNKPPEKIFSKTGSYRVMTSREDFGQCDPPISGMCEVYYIDKKRPQNK